MLLMEHRATPPWQAENSLYPQTIRSEYLSQTIHTKTHLDKRKQNIVILIMVL